MKIAISSTGSSLDDQIDPRFGRCTYFILIDPETMEYETIPNQNVDATSGAGTSAAQLVIDKGATVVLTGNLGPKAANVFGSSGTKIVTGVSGQVGEAIRLYAQNKDLSRQALPNQALAAGNIAPGMGAGQEFGSGRGMGGSRGMGGGCRQNGGNGRGMGRCRSTGGGRGMGGGRGRF